MWSKRSSPLERCHGYFNRSCICWGNMEMWGKQGDHCPKRDSCFDIKDTILRAKPFQTKKVFQQHVLSEQGALCKRDFQLSRFKNIVIKMTLSYFKAVHACSAPVVGTFLFLHPLLTVHSVTKHLPNTY